MELSSKEERLIEIIRKADICPANVILLMMSGLEQVGIAYTFGKEQLAILKKYYSELK